MIPKISNPIRSNELFLMLYAPSRQIIVIKGERMLKGTSRILTKTLINGTFKITRIMFPIYILVTTAQKISGLFFMIRGPGITPCTMKPANKSADTTVDGIPRVISGTNAPVAAALFAASGPATPSITPVPNFSGYLESFFSVA